MRLSLRWAFRSVGLVPALELFPGVEKAPATSGCDERSTSANILLFCFLWRRRLFEFRQRILYVDFTLLIRGDDGEIHSHFTTNLMSWLRFPYYCSWSLILHPYHCIFVEVLVLVSFRLPLVHSFLSDPLFTDVL